MKKICPQCNNLMLNKSYTYMGSFDSDYEDCLHEEYYCKKCKIVYVNGNWEIPSDIIATDKQIKTAIFISRVLGKETPIFTKKLLWKFISENLQEAIEVNNNDFSDWCEDNSDWLPEYF